jgi:outer membrane protein assembly factor BamB
MKRYLSYLAIASAAITVFRFPCETESQQAFSAPPEITVAESSKETPAETAHLEEKADPWDFESPPQPFEAVCWDDFRAADQQLTEDTARQWLEGIDDRPFNLTESSNTYGTAVTFQGLARLRGPWVDAAVLRCSFYSTQPFAFHFYNGQGVGDEPSEKSSTPNGVSLWFYPSAKGPTWAAYRITRRPGERLIIGEVEHKVIDSGLELLATDDQRNGHAFCGTYAVRYQDGLLVLTKGDVILLRAPMPNAPTEVYLEGNSAILRHLAMFRGGPAPIDRPHQREVVVHGRLPAVLPWKETLAPAVEFHRQRDGSVELVARPHADPAWVSLPLIRRGLYEVILEVEDGSPGAGIYLGDKSGAPVEGIGYFFDPRSAMTGFGFAKPNIAQVVPAMNTAASVSPYAPQRQWLRLVAACGTLRCWTSVDGRHWGQTSAPIATTDTEYSHIVLHLRTGVQQRRLVLRRLQVRQFDAITSLAPATIVERAAQLQLLNRVRDKNDYSLWKQQVWENLPRDVEPELWRRACAVAGLVAGPRPELGQSLLDELVNYSLSLATPVDAKLRVLRDAVLLGQSAAGDAKRFASHYDRLAATLIRTGDVSGFDRVRRAKMTIPLWTSRHGVEPLAAEIGHSSLLRMVHSTEPENADRLGRQLRFWNQSSHLAASWPGSQKSLEQLVDWTQTRDAADKPSEKSTPVQLHQWRHPLAVQIDKEAYNFYAELRSAIEEQAFEDSARMITSAATTQAAGLVRDTLDQRHFISIPTSVKLAMKRHKALQKTMVEQFDASATLQVRWAQSRSDATAVRNTTVRFHGTRAASEAHGWIADRLLNQGRFSLAIDHYKRAVPQAGTSKKHDLLAKLRLAAAMLGDDVGEKATKPISYDGFQLSAADFEQLVAEMIAVNSHDRHSSNGSTLSIPKPVRFQSHQFSEFPGGTIVAPDQIAALWNSPSWLARETSIVTSKDALYATDRYGITSVNQTNGKTNWTFSLSDKPAAVNCWRYQPSVPVIVGERIYVRLMSAENRPELVCLNRSTGEMVFNSVPPGTLASDPIFLGNRLFVCAVETANAALGSFLTLVELDPTTGTISRRSELTELRAPWNPQFTCGGVAVGDKICLALPAGVLYCDAAGDVLWVRQEPWVPSRLSATRNPQCQQRPLVRDNRVYFATEGVQGVTCVSLDTGELIWRLPLPSIQKIVGLTNNRMFVQTDDAIVQADASDGTIVWQHVAQDLVSCLLPTDESRSLCLLRYRPLAGAERAPAIVWLDAETGEPIASHLLLELHGKAATIGAIVAGENRLWCCTAKHDEASGIAAVRRIVELAPGENLDLAERRTYQSASSIAPSLRVGVERVLPGWMVLSGVSDDKTGLHAELAERAAVLVTKAMVTKSHTQPTRLVCQLVVPDSEEAFLNLNVCCDPLAQSRLVVRINGVAVLQHDLLPEPANQWQQLPIDLSAFAGESVTVTIVHEAQDGVAAYAYWSGIYLSAGSEE